MNIFSNRERFLISTIFQSSKAGNIMSLCRSTVLIYFHSKTVVSNLINYVYKNSKLFIPNDTRHFYVEKGSGSL